MCVLRIWRDPVQAHYVNAIGYRTYSNGNEYIRIIDGWQNSAEEGNGLVRRYIYSHGFESAYAMYYVAEGEQR